MSLQRRLTLFFVLIVVLPLAAAGYVVQRVVVGEVAQRARLALDPALDATERVIEDRAADIVSRMRDAVEVERLGDFFASAPNGSMDRYLTEALERSPALDFLVVVDDAGALLGSAATPGDFVEGFEQPTPGEIAQVRDGTGAGFETAQIPLRSANGEQAGFMAGGFWLDREVLVGLPDNDVDSSIVADGRVIASTATLGSPAPVSPAPGVFEVDIDGSGDARAAALGNGVSILSSAPTAPTDALGQRVMLSMLGLLALALLPTIALAYWLAKLIAQPLDELSAGAKAITKGRFDHRIPVRSRDEVGRLAEAFNEMSDRLGDTITQLSTSRDQLHRAVRRVGEILRSPHDMKQMLESILNTTADAIAADAAALWMFTPTREELYPVAAKGIEVEKLGRVPVGAGVVGLVAERGPTVVRPARNGGPKPAREEPSLPVSVAIPIYSNDRIVGVLCAYREDSDRPFTHEDVDTIAFLAEQGGVGIENVLLHEEAQRLSLTDGLTGVWNRRYFQMQFGQMLATAMRFERPFSVLMLDLDHFKRVNDNHGHQRGDATLVEFSKRVKSTLREVDIFARYGGEEFVCLLSETDLYGALTTAEKIREAIRTEPFGVVGEEQLRLTLSIGVASYPEHGDSFHSLVDAADRALYLAKQAGRDRVRLAEKPTPPGNLRLAT